MPSLRVEDVELSYSATGAGAPLVLLHGQGGDGESWSEQTAEFAPEFRVIAIDLRGHGASAIRREAVSMQQLAKEVAALCDRLGLAPFHLVGHSLGAMVALQLALDAPKLVRSLTVINGAAWGNGSKLRTAIIRGVIRLAGMRTFAWLNGWQHLPGPANAANRRRLIETMGACAPDGYLSAQAAVDAFDVRERLPAISCPVLVVHSANDVIPLGEKERLATAVEGAKLVTLPGSRHIPLWDSPVALNAVLRAFLTGR